ncbi:hypothetical protein D3C85_1433670 [compost metagenome]
MQPVHALGNRQCLTGRGDAILRIPAAIGQRTHAIAEDELSDALADRHDFTGHFQPGDGAHAGFHRVLARALDHVGAVDAGGVDADQYFAGPRGGDGDLVGLQDFGASGLGDFNLGHGFGQSHVVNLS